jgi:hypothetical protein
MKDKIAKEVLVSNKPPEGILEEKGEMSVQKKNTCFQHGRQRKSEN